MSEQTGQDLSVVVSSGELSAEKQAALEGLTLGMSVTESAQIAGVTRQTVNRWLREDPAFRAAFEQWQHELKQNCQAKLLMLTQKAAMTLDKAMEAGDAKAALQVLKGMGMLG